MHHLGSAWKKYERALELRKAGIIRGGSWQERHISLQQKLLKLLKTREHAEKGTIWTGTLANSQVHAMDQQQDKVLAFVPVLWASVKKTMRESMDH